MSQTASPPPPTTSASSRNKELFGDCALVEIIHLHECLRGAVKALGSDVSKMHALVQPNTNKQDPVYEESALVELERRVSGRFKVIWSVFRAHSAAEDEFIWPALRSKTQGMTVMPSPTHDHHSSDGETTSNETSNLSAQQSQVAGTAIAEGLNGHVSSTATDGLTTSSPVPNEQDVIVQEEYEEDHADEERMFSKMDDLLTQLRAELVQSTGSQAVPPPSSSSPSSTVKSLLSSLQNLAHSMSKHLMIHLEKEEDQCMPLVVKHLSKPEIDELVGKIMGKRSSEIIGQIMTMAVQSLNTVDREEMVKYMKQAMAGTFFDRWLSMSGWMDDKEKHPALKLPSTSATTITISTPTTAAADQFTEKKRTLDQANDSGGNVAKRNKEFSEDATSATKEVLIQTNSPTATLMGIRKSPANEVTNQAELEKLIRAIAANPNLSSQQKTTTIQGLRDSVWKNNQRLRRNVEDAKMASKSISILGSDGAATTVGSAAAASASVRRITPPSAYFKLIDSELVQVWNAGESPMTCPEVGTVPLFSAAELAPTYNDGATAAVLGCPHYARACKLRHPKSGKLYTCRLCCEQERDMPTKNQDDPLDRYAVTEVMCMRCNSVQPADGRCINPSCESEGKSFAKYYCKICHLYDDRPRPIFHCPYCNTCRMGKGLGIDYRHCVRCNACVLLADKTHRCIPQKLQGSCPICHESLFQSTQPLRGLQCGHVMHLSCFTEYRRQSYTCPLCCRSMECMKDYFALLDAAVRMQPMPVTYLSTISNIYCQDCEKTGQCRYHFVGQKCPRCSSYNTREMSRTQLAPTT